MAQPSMLLLSRFQGCLAGAVIGDCIGAVFEGFWADSIAIDKILEEVNKISTVAHERKAEDEDESVSVNSSRKSWTYTDDTAMARSVAASLIHNKGLDEKDMARRFAEEYFNNSFRGYGGSVTAVFAKLRESKYEDPFGPAKAQFNGAGSYGNGGAMRIAPAGVFGYSMNDTQRLRHLAEDITRITHTHYQAIQGAVLQTHAVDLALRLQGQVDVDQFINDLIDRMKPLEQETEEATRRNETAPEGESVKHDSPTYPYCKKLEKIRTFVHQDTPPTSDAINEELGTDISALEAVPAAVYSFLYSTKDIPQLEDRNAFEKTVIYAISLGGDTDTIATMAAAIAGACYGIEQVPHDWQTCCEGVSDALTYAEDIYKLQQISDSESVDKSQPENL